MSRSDFTNEHAVVLFSGGFDSTLVLANLVKNASDTDTIYAVTLEHNITGTQKLRREYESQLLILRELRKQFPKVKIEHERIAIESNWTVGDVSNSKGLAQPIFWICNLIPFLENNDAVYFGYNLVDQARVHLKDIEDLFNIACRFQDNKNIKPRFPISYLTKVDVLRELITYYPYLVDYCITCESINYDGTNVCGSCMPCTHLKEALFSLSLDNDTCGYKAREMLKERFYCTIDVSYLNDIKDTDSCERGDAISVDCSNVCDVKESYNDNSSNC